MLVLVVVLIIPHYQIIIMLEIMELLKLVKPNVNKNLILVQPAIIITIVIVVQIEIVVGIVEQLRQ